MSGISTTGTGDAILDADNDFTPPDKNIFRDNTIFREAGETSAVGIQMNTTSTANELAFSSNADGDPNYLTFSGTAQGVISLFGANSQINLDGAGSKIIFPDNTEQTTAGSALPNVVYNNYSTRGTGYSVGGGNPGNTTPDNKGGVLDAFPATATVSNIDGSSLAHFRLSGQVFGEWSADSWDKGMAIVRTRTPAAGGADEVNILRPPESSGRRRMLTHFVIGYHNNNSSTPESAIISDYNDSFSAAVGDTIKYEFVLINSGNTSRTFYINRVISSSTSSEVGESWISAMEISGTEQ